MNSFKGSNSRATGTAMWSDESGKITLECDTFTCSHCGTVVMVPTRQAEREMAPGTVMPYGSCMLCNHLICGSCADRGTCTPFERKLERLEAADRFHRQINEIYR